jgi:hypothetical protein
VIEFPPASFAAVDVHAAVDALVLPAFGIGRVVVGWAVQGAVFKVGMAEGFPSVGVLDSHQEAPIGPESRTCCAICS